MRGQLQDLIELGKEERPKIDWPTIPDADQQIEDQKADISEAERREIFNNLMDKVRPLATGVTQIKSLVEADLRGAHLRRADLTGAYFDDNTKWPDGFDPTRAGAEKIEN